MGKYIVKRILLMLFTLLVITLICFVLVRMLPPAELPLNDPHTKIIELRREAAGYNKPYLVQFWIFLKNVVTKFDWGVSDKLYFGQDVAAIFLAKLPATVIVNLYSIILSIPIGIALGVWAALKKNTWIDYTISTLTMIVISVPSFVYAFIIQYVLSFKLGWFPFLMKAGTDWLSWGMFVSMLPAVLSLSFTVIAGFTRTTRAELTEVLTSEFMLLARTKGLTQKEATWRHAFRNSLVPIANTIIPLITGIMGGSLVIEKIFAVPGEGGLLVDSILGGDHFLTVALLIFYSFISLVTIFVVDVSYGIIDPRIRIGGGK